MESMNTQPTWHRLSSLDRNARTAICSICGPTAVRIRENGEGRAQCRTKRREEHAKENRTRKRYPEKQREYSLKQRAKRYGWEDGFSVAHYEVLLAAQGGGCAICGAKEQASGRRLAIDHDHASGKIRGLLCTSCNIVLGRFSDDAQRFTSAARYLTKNVLAQPH